tara:strand:+ start:7657 stop:8277 length:621 start_codon:yes stop_codon:yes gene_type:complete
MIADLWQAQLTFGLFVFLLTPGFGLSPGLQRVRLLVFLAIGYIPIAGLSLADYMRSFTGDLAITSLVALAYWTAVRTGFAPRQPRAKTLQIVAVMACLALFLYPATMGLSYLDPYRLGYQPRPLILFVGLLTLALLALQNRLGACMLALATLAFSVGLKSATNYWDYLIDPFIALYSCFALIGFAISRLWRNGSAKRRDALSSQPG